MPPVSRISDTHVCPAAEAAPVPHVGGPVVVGEPTVIMAVMPAVRLGDACNQGGAVVTLAPSVMIGG